MSDHRRRERSVRRDRVERERATQHRPTQLSTTDAMRAREVAVPTAADLAAAAADIQLVRRHYTPPDDQAAPSRS